ncbi:MAG: hypothetical protein LBL90_13965 [Prevotellaceae bacterium]|jgi:hypothetical protein|nr:hypothetical protein [Prevotellaceae bacterium]
MKPLLLVLATDMVYPQGGLKHTEALGSNGKTIVDYTIYDAIRAGFAKILFVIRKGCEQEMKTTFESRYGGLIDIDLIPFDVEINKQKMPAYRLSEILAAKKTIDVPFAVITAAGFIAARHLSLWGNIYMH